MSLYSAYNNSHTWPIYFDPEIRKRETNSKYYHQQLVSSKHNVASKFIDLEINATKYPKWWDINLTSSNNILWRIRPEIAKQPLENNLWMYHAYDLLNTEEWVFTVWSNECWYQDSEYFSKHFLHVSLADPSKVAFISNAEHGNNKREIRMTPGRYLKKFFNFSDQEIKEKVTQFMEYHVVTATDVKFATTEEDIEWVYENGPMSCMVQTNPERYIKSTTHPCRVYATPDLAVAYLAKNKTRVSQRCLVNQQKKTYTTVYGEGSLIPALHMLGYQEGSLEGCRIQVLYDTETHKELMPYIDNGLYVSEVIHDTELGYDVRILIGTGDTNPCTSTDGYFNNGEEVYTCPCCEEDYGDLSYFINTQQLYDQSESVCMSCIDSWYYNTDYGFTYHTECVLVQTATSDFYIPDNELDVRTDIVWDDKEKTYFLVEKEA